MARLDYFGWVTFSFFFLFICETLKSLFLELFTRSHLSLAFCVCEKPNYRNYSKLKPISSTTLMKYMRLLTNAVEERIAEMLPKKFPLIFDGWTLEGSSTHHVAVFARWFNDQKGISREKMHEQN